jgi:hypothetical protein
MLRKKKKKKKRPPPKVFLVNLLGPLKKPGRQGVHKITGKKAPTGS